MTEVLPEVMTAYSGHEKEAESMRTDMEELIDALRFRHEKLIKLRAWDSATETYPEEVDDNIDDDQDFRRR